MRGREAAPKVPFQTDEHPAQVNVSLCRSARVLAGGFRPVCLCTGAFVVFGDL